MILSFVCHDSSFEGFGVKSSSTFFLSYDFLVILNIACNEYGL